MSLDYGVGVACYCEMRVLIDRRQDSCERVAVRERVDESVQSVEGSRRRGDLHVGLLSGARIAAYVWILVGYEELADHLLGRLRLAVLVDAQTRDAAAAGVGGRRKYFAVHHNDWRAERHEATLERDADRRVYRVASDHHSANARAVQQSDRSLRLCLQVVLHDHKATERQRLLGLISCQSMQPTRGLG